ncbi:MAG: hypothetical protein ACK54P_01635, partial [Bacteroidota bacterium]
MAQDVQLYTEDFETGGSSFTINSGGPGGNSGDSQWIINNQYSGGGTFPNTTLQSVTAGGTIGFAPQSNYLHIHDVPSGITNNNSDNTTSADRFAHMTTGICTYGLEDVHLSFFYLCEGSASAVAHLRPVAVDESAVRTWLLLPTARRLTVSAAVAAII